MSLEEELRVIWAKYEPQRSAERDAVRTREEATRELREFNERRFKLGLQPVSEWTFQQSVAGVGFIQIPTPKTWRDDMDAEILSAVKRFFG